MLQLTDDDRKERSYFLLCSNQLLEKRVQSLFFYVTEYTGKYVYRNSVLQYMSTPEGYATPEGTGYRYVYQFKDHLDNVRLSYTKNDTGTLEIVEESNYYPFGLEHKGYNNVVSSNANSAASKYRYNGKEIQEELGLDMYDYGARNYDPALGRWFGVDALAEDYHSSSPYAFVGNNPMTNLEIDGRFWIRTVGEDGTVSYEAESGDSAQSLYEQFGKQDGLTQESANALVEGTLGSNYIRESDGMLMSDVEVGDTIDVYTEQESTGDTTVAAESGTTQQESASAKLEKQLSDMNPVLYAAMYLTGGVDIARNGATYQDMAKTDPEGAMGLMMTKGQASITINTLTPTPGVPGSGGSGSVGTTGRRARSGSTGTTGSSGRNSRGTVTVSGQVKTVQTGSRGGKFYINKNGNKTYLNRDGTKRN